MRAKLETPVREPVAAPEQASPEIWAAMREVLATRLHKATTSAPRGSAAGWSGDRFEFHKAAFAASSGEAWAAYLDAATDVATGRAPPEVADGWRVARGFALLKEAGSDEIRPIAAHEPLRRAVTRALLKDAEEPVLGRLAPLQTAIGVPGGAEAFGLAAGLFAQRHPSWVMLKLDVANAFGTCSRAEALRELEAAGATLLAFFLRRQLSAPSRFAYDFTDEAGRPARLWIDACEGADQGDPAGPVVFCASFARALRRIRARLSALPGEAPFAGAYMDDLALVVPPQHVGFPLKEVAAALAEVGLALSGAKSRAWSACGALPPAEGLSAVHEGETLSVLPAPDGFSVAGVPVGSVAARVPEAVLDTARRDCARLQEMCEHGPGGRERCESARKLLLQCIQLRLDFLSRVLDPRELLAGATVFDALIFDTFCRIYGLQAFELTTHLVAQIHTPEARGGPRCSEGGGPAAGRCCRRGGGRGVPGELPGRDVDAVLRRVLVAFSG